MVANPVRRRWFQFRLQSLLLLTVICALATTCWRQWNLSAELTAMSQELQLVKLDLEHYRAFDQVFYGLDLETAQDRQALVALRSTGRGWPLGLSQQKRIVDRDVLLFHYDSPAMPGSVYSAAFAMHEGRLIDFVFREASNRFELHGIGFRDVDGDGAVEVVIDIMPGAFGHGDKATIAYKILNSGFALMD